MRPHDAEFLHKRRLLHFHDAVAWVPLLEHFATRFIEADAVANRQKPSEVATKRSILNAHLIPNQRRSTMC
jgi:hypothetical protein